MRVKSRTRADQERIDGIITMHRRRGATLADVARALEAEGFKLGRSRISERAIALGLRVNPRPEPRLDGGELDAAFRDFERSLEVLRRAFSKLHSVLARRVRS